MYLNSQVPDKYAYNVSYSKWNEIIESFITESNMVCLYKLWPDLINYTLGSFLIKMKCVLVCYLLTIMTAYRYRASHQFVFHKYQWRDNSMPNRTQLVFRRFQIFI